MSRIDLLNNNIHNLKDNIQKGNAIAMLKEQKISELINQQMDIEADISTQME